MNAKDFSNEVAEKEYYKANDVDWISPLTVWMHAWITLRELVFGEEVPFVPTEPVVINGPLPTPLPEFEGIDYPIGGKPEEEKRK